MARPTETRLRRAFTDVIAAVLATAAGAVVVAGATGCGGTTSTPGGGGTGPGPGGGGGGPTPEFTSLCGSDTSRSFLANMKVDPPLDGAVMRNESAFLRGNVPFNGGAGGVTPPGDIPDDWKGTNGETVGALCSKASNQGACLSKVGGYRILPISRAACESQYPIGVYSLDTCGIGYILYTRGDAIGVARNEDEIKALIGTIDTVDEALWVAGNSKYQTSCGMGSGLASSEYRTTQDGGYDLRLVENTCGPDVYNVVVHVDYAGNLTVISREKVENAPGCPVAGRRPEGLRLAGAKACGSDSVGEHFASMATLEAASVVAFRRLHRQLAAFGAPEELLTRIRKAVRDEIRHARATSALARKYGVVPSAPQITGAEESPSLFAIALENAREGCVRETYGALVAQLQTSRAADADVRAAMAAIADEETEHAALSWDIASWIEAQLSTEDRARLAAERRDAFATLARELAVPVDARLAHTSGIPTAPEATHLLTALEPLLAA